jgi:hypothetical protein
LSDATILLTRLRRGECEARRGEESDTPSVSERCKRLTRNRHYAHNTQSESPATRWKLVRRREMQGQRLALSGGASGFLATAASAIQVPVNHRLLTVPRRLPRCAGGGQEVGVRPGGACIAGRSWRVKYFTRPRKGLRDGLAEGHRERIMSSGAGGPAPPGVSPRSSVAGTRPPPRGRPPGR